MASDCGRSQIITRDKRAQKPLQVLVVEDDEAIASVMALALRRHLSAEVSIAGTFTEAESMCSESEYDLVTLDHSLPDGDGLELLDSLGASNNAPPVIVVTGRGDEETAARCMRAGAAGYVIKDQTLTSNLLHSADSALELHRAQASLRESEEKYRSLFENMIEGLAYCRMIFDEEGRPVDWVYLETNRAFSEITGLEDVNDRRVTEVIQGIREANPELFEIYGRVATTGIPESFESRVEQLKVDFFVRVTSPSPGHFVAVFEDVTDQKAMQGKLEESEELFRQISEVSNDAIVVVDSRGLVNYWNPGAQRAFGYQEDEALGSEFLSLLSHPEDLQKYTGMIEDFVKTGGGPIQGGSFEVEAVRKSGEVFPVEISTSTFMRHGEWNAAINLRDITERVRAEDTIRRHARELGDLIDVAAHELRHPATIFKGYASILMRYGDDLEADLVQEAIQAIDRGADRLAVLINKLFDTSRIEGGNIVLDLAETDPWELARDAVADIEPESGDRPFELAPRQGKWTLFVDRDKIRTVLLIILDNAVKHTPDGTSIGVTCESRDGMTVFCVTDTDPGIPEHAREMVFERFYQVEDASHHSKPGIGLGLYIARNYVEAHGGWIKVEPRAGGGSVFCFALPERPAR